MNTFSARKKIGLAGLAATAALVLGLSSGSAASPGVSYDISGTATIDPSAPNPIRDGISDVVGCSMSAQGIVSTASAPPGAPASGTFTLAISEFKTLPPNPCRTQTTSGTLRVSWTTAARRQHP